MRLAPTLAALGLSVIAAGCSQQATVTSSLPAELRTAWAKPSAALQPRVVFRSLHSFNFADGALPRAGLILVGSNLFGTTYSGGALHNGTVFEMDPSTGAESWLYSFRGDRLGIEGSNPRAGLTLAGGNLYGTTELGGFMGDGGVFEVQLDQSSNPTYYRNIHTFMSCTTGSVPRAGLTLVGGKLYGTTFDGGAGCSHGGTVFDLDPRLRALHLLCSFNGTDGANPETSLTLMGSQLYGTTYFGGANGKGTVFEVDPSTGAERALYSFRNGTDGAYPEAGLTLVASKLYGTTHAGGANGKGTIFEVDPSNGRERVLYTFNGTDGADPRADLTLVGSKLYGTTYTGGANDKGTVFDVDPSTGAERVLYSFNGTDGANPEAGLTLVGSKMYGTTFAGGANAYGTVFEITP